jgi:hypothetical protein
LYADFRPEEHGVHAQGGEVLQEVCERDGGVADFGVAVLWYTYLLD